MLSRLYNFQARCGFLLFHDALQMVGVKCFSPAEDVFLSHEAIHRSYHHEIGGVFDLDCLNMVMFLTKGGSPFSTFIQCVKSTSFAWPPAVFSAKDGVI
jgi:hypothetical protein